MSRTLPEWMDGRAPCAQVPELFLRAGDTSSRSAAVRAIRVCLGCPFLEPCRLRALQTPETWGVWGGMTAEMRYRFLRINHREDSNDVTALGELELVGVGSRRDVDGGDAA